MSLISIFGLNGSGKDTLIAKLKYQYPKIVLISGSRVMMKSLGLQVDITTDFPISREYYELLEKTPNNVKMQIFDNEYFATLKEFNNTGRTGIILNHLVVPRKEHGHITFDSQIRPWYLQVYSLMIYIKAKPEEIYLRQERDRVSGKRVREIFTLDEIKETEIQSDQLWHDLFERPNMSEYLYVVYNHEGQIDKAVEDLTTILYSLDPSIVNNA